MEMCAVYEVLQMVSPTGSKKTVKKMSISYFIVNSTKLYVWLLFPQKEPYSIAKEPPVLIHAVEMGALHLQTVSQAGIHFQHSPIFRLVSNIICNLSNSYV